MPRTVTLQETLGNYTMTIEVSDSTPAGQEKITVTGNGINASLTKAEVDLLSQVSTSRIADARQAVVPGP